MNEEQLYQHIQYKAIGHDPTDAVTGILEVFRQYESLSLAAKQSVLNFVSNVISIESTGSLSGGTEQKAAILINPATGESEEIFINKLQNEN